MDDTPLANVEARNVCPELSNDARELVAQGYRNGIVRAGVRRRGRESRTTKVFMEISAADAYVRRCDLY